MKPMHGGWRTPALLLAWLAGCSGADPQAELTGWRDQQVIEARPMHRDFDPPSGCLADGSGCFVSTPTGRLPPFDTRRLDAVASP